jgi:hypothetical protein
MYCTIFETKENSKIDFSDLTKLLTHGFGYSAHCGSALTLSTHRYHKNRGSMMLLASFLRLTAKILVERVIFADITWMICMHLVMLCATGLQHSIGVSSCHNSYMVVISTNFCTY